MSNLAEELRNYRPEPTRYKRVFSDHGIPTAAVVRATGYSYGYVCGLLSGLFPMSAPAKKKLDELVEALESE